MTPQELKNSILQLAIQGKLVVQHAEEGTGENQYEKISIERAELIQQKKFKWKQQPTLSEDELPFDVPDSWKWVRLGDIISVASGKGLTSTQMVDGPIPIYGGNGITGYHNKSLLHEETVVIGRVGFYCGSIHISEKESWVTDNAFITTYPQLSIDRGFLVYILGHLNLGRNNNATAQPVVSGKKIYPVPFPIPPLSEQKRIVAKIEELLPYIDCYEQAWRKLEDFNKRFPSNMQKSILQIAIQGKLVEHHPEEGTGEELYQQIQAEKQKLIKAGTIKKEKPLLEITEDEKPFDIPESWSWVRVGSITSLNPKNILDDNLDVAFIPMACVSDGFRNQHMFEVRKWKEIKKGFTHFANGDIGVAKITPCFQNRKSVIFSKLENGYGAGTTELSIIRVLNNTLVHDYLLWFFKTDHFITNGVKSFSGTAGQQRIHKDYLATCLIPLPPLDEQMRIVAKLEEVLPLCEKLK